ncbi:MAG: hypothetical protein KDJ14_17050 [Xanthomonadales bacterium]|nr:hypothetical protein [Xanthomonadales bacterium]
MRFSKFLAAACVLLCGSVQAQSILYGISFSGSDGQSTLHRINLANGVASAVGPIGFERCGAMDASPTGVLFAACERSDGSDTPVLITIDIVTGAGTEVGPTGMTGAVGDLSFRPSDGVLFAYDATNDPTHSIFTVNTTTGAATEVGDTTLSFAGGNGMAFSAGGTLYQSQFTVGPNSDLNTINTTTGAATLVAQIPGITGRFSAMDANPDTGVMYAALNEGGGGGGPNSLVTLDPTGPSATVLGATVNGLDAIAFGPLPPPPAPIPAANLGGLLVILLGVLLTGWVMVRSRD